jgi:CRP-like cAMP-binding protein
LLLIPPITQPSENGVSAGVEGAHQVSEPETQPPDELSNSPVFSDLECEKLESGMGSDHKRNFVTGELIIRERDPASGLFFILDGEVEVRHGSNLISRLGRGQFFGESAFIENEPRSADVFASQPTSCLVLTPDQLRNLIAANPEIALKIIEELTRRSHRRATPDGQTTMTLEAIDRPSQFPSDPERFRFKSQATVRIFDYLVRSFIEDSMASRLSDQDSGWRSLSRICREAKVSKYSLYGRPGKKVPALEEPIQRGLVEIKIFTGERGRGGEIVRLRVACEKGFIRHYVDQQNGTGM